MKSIGIFQVTDAEYAYLLAKAQERDMELEDLVKEVVQAAIAAASDNH